MEYPKTDRDPHLLALMRLALMRRRFEEAIGPGVEGPRLEYREDPPDLMIRVAGVDAAEEIHLGGYYHGRELIE